MGPAWRRRDDDGTYVVQMQSTEHANAPAAAPGCCGWFAPVRCRVDYSGYTLAPLQAQFSGGGGSQETLVTHVLKVAPLAAPRAAGGSAILPLPYPNLPRELSAACRRPVPRGRVPPSAPAKPALVPRGGAERGCSGRVALQARAPPLPPRGPDRARPPARAQVDMRGWLGSRAAALGPVRALLGWSAAWHALIAPIVRRDSELRDQVGAGPSLRCCITCQAPSGALRAPHLPASRTPRLGFAVSWRTREVRQPGVVCSATREMLLRGRVRDLLCLDLSATSRSLWGQVACDSAKGAHAARPGPGRPRRSALWCARSCWAPRTCRCRRRRPRSRPRRWRCRRSPCRRRRRRRSMAAPRWRRRPRPLWRRGHTPGQATERTGLGGARQPPKLPRAAPRRSRSRPGSGPSLRRRSAPPRSLQLRLAPGAGCRAGRPGHRLPSACTGTTRPAAGLKDTSLCTGGALDLAVAGTKVGARGGCHSSAPAWREHARLHAAAAGQLTGGWPGTAWSRGCWSGRPRRLRLRPTTARCWRSPARVARRRSRLASGL